MSLKLGELPEATDGQLERMVGCARKVSERLPEHWQYVSKFGPTGRVYVHKFAKLKVIYTFAVYEDSKIWMHASISRPDRVPDYNDLVKLKEEFIGQDMDAVMVLPKKEKHVNLHPYVLHLLACIEGSPLPDFTGGGETI